MRLYKVVEFKQRSIMKGQMNSFGLQSAINEWAARGWEFDKIVAGETAVILGAGAKDVFLLIFRKSFDFPNDVFLIIDNVQMERPILEYEFRNLVLAGKISPSTLALRPKMTSWIPLSGVSPDMADAAQFLTTNQ
ncbi:MAG: DUF4177 domain-containing protein [Acidobacteriota bacterium]|nr:DUF4177 domain-containing protein [Acidobacteriota bacterium]